jgi:hypothetical protein
VKTIVATQHAELQAELQRDLLRRSDLRLVVTRGLPDLLGALQKGADLCLLSRNLDGASVASAIAAIRADRRCALVPVVLLSGGGGLERGERRGDFDEVLELPAAPGALSLLLSRYLGVPLREGERFAVRVHVFSAAQAEGRDAKSDGPPPAEYLGTTVDLSEVGLLLKTRRPLPVGDRLGIRFTLPGHPGELDLQARVVRTDERSFAPELGVALGFTTLSEVDRRALRDYLQTLQSGRPFRWHIVREGDRQVISLSGVLRADAELTPLRQLRGELDFRLRDFRRISSDSIQTWLDLIRSLRGASKIRLFECPIAFIQQANAISNLLEQTQVCSFYAPYVCPRCGLDEERLIDVGRDLTGPDGQVSRRPPAFPCPSCGTALSFDDIPERYFAFL